MLKSVIFLSGLLFISGAQASLVELDNLFSELSLMGGGLAADASVSGLDINLAEAGNAVLAPTSSAAGAKLVFDYSRVCALDLNWVAPSGAGDFAGLPASHFRLYDENCILVSADTSSISTAPKREQNAVSYALDASITEKDLFAPYVDNTGWQLSDTDNMSFAVIRDTLHDMPGSGSIALLGLGIVALGMFRRKEASKLRDAE